MKFFTSSINNHIGSDIEYQTGSYDSVKKEFTYDWDSEIISGKLQKSRRIVRIIDGSHYTETYFEQQSGAVCSGAGTELHKKWELTWLYNRNVVHQKNLSDSLVELSFY